MSQFTIETQELNYSFNKEQKTLQQVNLQVQEGSIYGFLGPNGAGKTTTLRLVLGLLTKQEGKVEVFGKEIGSHRIEILRNVGSLIEQPSLYGHLTAKENLEVYRKVYGARKERIQIVLELVDLQNTGSKKAKQFSLGMKQRLSIAIALLHAPKLLILDEPTNGLDPNGIIETRELIKKLNKEQGVTILVSSHILAEIERMASHVGIIHKGKLLFQGTLPELQHLKNKQSFLQVDTTDNEAAYHLLAQKFSAEKSNGLLKVPVNTKEEAAIINRTLIQNGIDVHLLQPQQNDLEQLFIDITSNN
jgi:ABC-type multidrug transport system ATPase subunit